MKEPKYPRGPIPEEWYPYYDPYGPDGPTLDEWVTEEWGSVGADDLYDEDAVPDWIKYDEWYWGA